MLAFYLRSATNSGQSDFYLHGDPDPWKRLSKPHVVADGAEKSDNPIHHSEAQSGVVNAKGARGKVFPTELGAK